jgi:hypothetical protein
MASVDALGDDGDLEVDEDGGTTGQFVERGDLGARSDGGDELRRPLSGLVTSMSTSITTALCAGMCLLGGEIPSRTPVMVADGVEAEPDEVVGDGPGRDQPPGLSVIARLPGR